MPNAAGGNLGNRPTEGYSKSIQASDPIALDSAGNPIVTEVGDAFGNAVRVGGGWLKLIGLTLVYMAAGGVATGLNIWEYLSAAGLELDPSMASLDNEPGGLFNPPH